MGIWAECVRAGGFGLGGVVSPCYRGDEKKLGKTVITLEDGKEYVIEKPLRADVCFVKAWRADPYGNLQFRQVGATTNAILATAADYVVAEVNEIVEVGDIPMDQVGVAAPWINAVVKGYDMEEQHVIYQELWDSRGRLAKSNATPACDPNDYREIIARRAALEINDGDVVNLGIGIPTAAANYLPEGVFILLHAENGLLGYGKTPVIGTQDSDIFNAGAQPVTVIPGASTFDQCTSFGLIRGGKVDTSILGTLEVDQEGNIANWGMELEPGSGRIWPGMGGAMELVAGAQKVVVVMQHCDKKGNSKVLKKCVLPLTGSHVVDVIITEKAVFYVKPEGLLLKEIFPGLTVDDIRKVTDAEFTVAPDLCEYQRAVV
jgi:3-oxoacid CoA-transferase B subunit